MRLLDDLRAKRDLYARNGGSASLLRAVLADGTLANALYRLQAALARGGLGPLAWLVHMLNKWITGCVIGIRADFGTGFVLVHPIGVVINSSVRAGDRVVIESGVVIGDNHGKSPVLGDDIFIGSGAKIIGNVRIGSGSRIGANAVVLHDVAPGSTVVGVPARAVASPRDRDG